jgi:hypothetical protein
MNDDQVDALRFAIDARHQARLRRARTIQWLMWLALATAVAVAVLA